MASRSTIIDVIWHTCGDVTNINSVAELAAAAGLRVRTLERKCAASGITAKALLDFVRCMKAIRDSDTDWNETNLFPDLDPRTSDRLCQRAGLSSVKPTLSDFIVRQRFIRNRRLLAELLAHVQSG